MAVFEGWSDDAILVELGDRLRRERLNRDVSQEALAGRAGVSLGTLRNAEAGTGSSMTTFIRLLRALGMIPRMDAVLPESEISPMQLLVLKGESRVRASGAGRIAVSDG
jgi:transcriptional regulator with XRE-family HTH domain